MAEQGPLPTRRTAGMARLLNVDPDLGALLPDTRREQAHRKLIVRTHRLPIGPWDISRLAGAAADHIAC
jgi:CRP/FNR family cyclic AMP-dependent transcriptional regulator